MNLSLYVGCKVEMKKNHPCGKKAVLFTILRVGADIKIKCDTCGREIMLPRLKIEKMIKKTTDIDIVDMTDANDTTK